MGFHLLSTVQKKCFHFKLINMPHEPSAFLVRSLSLMYFADVIGKSLLFLIVGPLKDAQPTECACRETDSGCHKSKGRLASIVPFFSFFGGGGACRRLWDLSSPVRD